MDPMNTTAPTPAKTLRAFALALAAAIPASAAGVSALPTLEDNPTAAVQAVAPSSASDFIPLDYCFTPQGGTQTCYGSLEEAEAAMRASTPIGRFLYAVSTARNSSASWMTRRYTADNQEPESLGEPGFAIGVGAEALGCARVILAGSELCTSESEMVSLYVERRRRALLPNCEYRRHQVSGSYGAPQSIAGSSTYPPTRYGGAWYGEPVIHNPGARHLDEEWWCPGWGRPEPNLRKQQISKLVPFTCPAGFVIRGDAEDWPLSCRPISPDFQISVRIRQTEACPANANPCYPGTGEKQRREVDLMFAGTEFFRSYRSAGQASAGGVGERWIHSYASHMLSANGNATRMLVGSDGSLKPMSSNGTVGGIRHHIAVGLSTATARAVNGTYEVLDADGRISVYHATNGRLLRRRDPANAANDVELEYDAAGVLVAARDAQQRRLVFGYTDTTLVVSSGIGATGSRRAKLLTSITLPDGGVVGYHYDALGRLVEVTYPDGTRRGYHYAEPALSAAASPFLLTGITDERGQRFASFGYDAQGRVTSSTLAPAVERTTLRYVSASDVEVTTPGGDVRRYTFGADAQRRLQAITDGAGTATWTYNGQQRLTERRDRSGRITRYTYANELVATVTEAPGLPEERVTAFTRDAMGRVTKTIVSRREGTTLVPMSEERRVYDADGRVVSVCAAEPGLAYDCAPGTGVPDGVRRYRMSYAGGRLVQIDGPREDVADFTSIEYHAEADAGCGVAGGSCRWRAGDVAATVNALGHRTEWLRYDAAGRVLEQRDPNGLVTRFDYDARGRLVSVDTAGMLQGMGYTPAGQIAWTMDASGRRYDFDYDDAQRLVAVVGPEGRIDWTLDAAGQRIREEVRDADGQVRRRLQQQFDALSRAVAVTRASGIPTLIERAPDGTPSLVSDPLGRTDATETDALGRLATQLRDVGGLEVETTLEHDALDRLARVVDPKGLATEYSYDGLSNLVGLSSPDTGITTYAVNAAGQRTRQVDARGVAVDYAYDALGRLTSIDFGGAPHLRTTFEYDVATGCPAGETSAIGRLSGFTDRSGSTRFCYDARGLLVRRTQVTSGRSLVTTYTHDAAGLVATQTLPGGSRVSIERVQGEIVAARVRLPGETADTPLVAGIARLPFGPLSRIDWGNGAWQQRAYDADYMIQSITSSVPMGLTQRYGVDAAGNIVEIEPEASMGPATYGYDGLDRLVSADVPGTFGVDSYRWTVDGTGNRTSYQHPGRTPTPYVYAADSHRLLRVGSAQRTYDAAGYPQRIGTQRLTYDQRGRLSLVQTDATKPATIGSYEYNALGQRVSKFVPGRGATLFAYDEAGQLVGEYPTAAGRSQEFVWIDGLPMGVVTTEDGVSRLHYIEADHLGTPRAVIDPVANEVVWRWEAAPDPFGTTLPARDLASDGTVFELHLRFPGQYYDAETRLHYNYFRNYEPLTGRYIESDPIGLAGGISTFAYVDSAPTVFADPYGLSKRDVERIRAIFQRVSGEMQRYGQRLPGDRAYENNLRRMIGRMSFGLAPDAALLDCGEQTEFMNAQLWSVAGGWQADGSISPNLFDARWRFDMVAEPGHAWGMATSSDPQDPVIYYDTRSGEIQEDFPCRTCLGFW